MTEPMDHEALADRVRALEAENARLTAKSSSPRAERPKGGNWRAAASVLCIVVASILVAVSIVTTTARIQLIDEDAFVATLAPLVDDPAVQSMIIDESMDAITAQLDLEAVTEEVFDGVASLGLPPRAAQALQMLQVPAASGLENLVRAALTRIVESDAFSDVWATATRAAHRAFTLAATSDGNGLIVRTDDGVGIQLGAVVERIKANLIDRDIGVAELIPAVDRVLILGDGEKLMTVRAGYALVATVGWGLPMVTIALFGLGILLARRRSTAVLGTGLGLAFGGGSLAIALSFGSAAVEMLAGEMGLSATALDVIYNHLVGSMTHTGVVLVLLGLFVAMLGWLMGRWAPAKGLRRTVQSVNESARRRLAARGLDTGALGTWLGRQRILVRTIIAVLAVLWLFTLRPLSVGDIVLAVVIAFAVAWILELLQRRPEDPATTDAAERSSKPHAGRLE